MQFSSFCGSTIKSFPSNSLALPCTRLVLPRLKVPSLHFDPSPLCKVSDELATQDAQAIYWFLQRRGYIGSGPGDTPLPPLPALKREGSELSAVDMVEAEKFGIVAWKVRPGSTVRRGDVLGEIVDIEDPDAARTAVVSRTDGIVFSMVRHKLVQPGQVIIKVAGMEVLEWRKGNLLTSK